MKEKICVKCEKGTMVEVDNIISEIEGHVFVERGWRCTACGEEFVKEEDAQRTIVVARRLGVWPAPMKLHRSLSRSGRGLVLRIPSDLESELNLRAGESVAISKIGHKLVIEPEPKHKHVSEE